MRPLLSDRYMLQSSDYLPQVTQSTSRNVRLPFFPSDGEWQRGYYWSSDHDYFKTEK